MGILMGYHVVPQTWLGGTSPQWQCIAGKIFKLSKWGIVQQTMSDCGRVSSQNGDSPTPNGSIDMFSQIQVPVTKNTLDGFATTTKRLHSSIHESSTNSVLSSNLKFAMENGKRNSGSSH